tara:strand:- start:1131 stop:1289 length:159 start_codon:yes stop_codon:yes gene_type:complete
MEQIKLDVYYSDYSEPTPKINIFDVEEMMRNLENELYKLTNKKWSIEAREVL